MKQYKECFSCGVSEEFGTARFETIKVCRMNYTKVYEKTICETCLQILITRKEL